MILFFRLLLSLFFTGLLFYSIAYMHVDRIDVADLMKKPTHFYKLYRFKRTQKIQKHVKKKIEKKIREKKLAKQVSSKAVEEERLFCISQLEEQVEILTPVIPKYPDIARKAGIECKVLLSLIIDEKGKVIHKEVVFCSQPGLGGEANALRAVNRLFFKPVYQDGKAVKVNRFYPFQFVLVE